MASLASFKCIMGMNCSFEVKDADHDELIQIIALHAEKTHNMKRPLPADVMEKVNKAIKK